MGEVKDNWVTAGEHFADLSRTFTQRYAERVDADESGAATDRLQDAVSSALEAVGSVLRIAGETVRDPSMAEQADRAVGALRDALAVTFVDARDEIEAAADRLRKGLGVIPPLEDDPASHHA